MPNIYEEQKEGIFETFISFCQRLKIYTPLRKEYEKTLKKLNPPQNSKILEIGTGNISYKKYFPNCDFISSDMDASYQVDDVVDVHNIKYPDNYFDVVLFHGILEHIESPEQALDEIYRVLKPSGIAIVSTIFFFPYHYFPSDYWRFTEQGLKLLLKKFKIVEFKIIKWFLFDRLPLGFITKVKK
ncbi:MAG: class I SAM-dependent methyltransferase [Candidatus Hydrothermarchaeota archaeon]|nr:class I SAM-dependent methyltransferase [Candidatus Hydrothermarchaeota archaeon]